MKRPIFLLIMFFLLNGCSSVKKMAVGTTAGFFYDASFEMQNELDWNYLKDSMPGMLKLLEGIRSLKPGDEELTVSLIKGYTGYAFGVWETLALKDQLSENDRTYNTKRALHFYSRAVEFGLEFLKENGIAYDDLLKAINKENGIVELLDSHLDSGDHEDKEGALYFAQALGGLINLQKTDISLVAQLPITKGMFDWVCVNDPDFNYGTCDIFYGAYEAGRPKMLGGNPEKGREIFEKAIKKNPNNWLARVAYVQYYAIPMADEDVYDEQKGILKKAISKLEKEKYWSPNKKPQSELAEKRMRVFQAIAIERFKIIKKYENDVF